MIVRKLRITSNVNQRSEALASIDNVEDPVMLAHRLINFDSVERRNFPNKLRMSQMHNVCVRGQLLAYRNNISSREMVSPGMQVTFDIGNALHEFFQNSYKYLGNNRLGWWRCVSCDHVIFGRKPSQKCIKCGASPEALRYLEHTLNLPKDIPVSGHIDCFLEVSPGDVRVLDFKTINGEDFANLQSPKAEHCIQVNGYMHYIQSDLKMPIRINPERGLLLYISKKHVAKSLPFKIFHVKREPIYIDFISNNVKLFKQGLDTPTFLPEPSITCVETKFTSYHSRSCPVHNLCVKELSKKEV